MAAGLERHAALRNLNLNDSTDTVLPSRLPPNLTQLNLNGCGLTAPPPCLSCLQALEALELGGNLFGGKDLSILSALSPSLRCLSLTNCELAAAPPALSTLTGLRSL